MNKIKLNSEEKEFLQDIKAKMDEMVKINLEVKSQVATFWKEFNGEHGICNYRMDVEKGEIFSISLEEAKEFKEK